MHVTHCAYGLAALNKKMGGKKKSVYLWEPRNAFKSKIILHAMQIESFLAAVTGSVTVSLKIF